MNAVEIEEAISRLAEQPFDAGEFPFAFLQAFGNKETTLKRLRKGESNKSDFAGPWGGVLQTNNIHIAVAAPGAVTNTLAALKASPATTRAKAKFVLATDGDTFEAEDLASGETVACAYADFPDHFGFFLPLAGITTVKQVRDSSFDIRATSRLNRLYVELLKDNPGWGTAERRPDMNHFMARLIFCFFAEDTDIFEKPLLFTSTVEQMSEKDSSNTHEVIGTLLDIDLIDRINPFGEAYAILARTMSEESLKQVAAVIGAKRVNLTPEEARELARRALKFKQERGRLPSITSPDAWEKRMAEGVAFLARMKAEAARG